MPTKPTSNELSAELSAEELDKVTGAGGGLHFGMISGPPSPPGPPVVLHRGFPIGH
jgi:hypothetical protein